MVLIASMIIWNCDNQRAVYGFHLLADDNPAFSSATVLGSFLVDNDGPGDRMAPHPLPFAPNLASHVRMEIISNNGPDPLNVQMSEVLLRDIRNVQITQGPLQRLTNADNIGISSAGQAGFEIHVPGILPKMNIPF